MKNLEYGTQTLSKREYACIHLGIPESGDVELDDLIRKSERKKLAAQMAAGVLASGLPWELKMEASEIVEEAEAMVDELTKKA